MDPKAASTYIAALKHTESRTKAMAAFWRICDNRVPRPQEKIAAVKMNGLKLESGREIKWFVAGLKLKNNELDVSGDIKPRLLNKLQELGVGQRIWTLLQ
jgi:hypothetical protein